MSRRLLALVALVLSGVLSAGCADDVAPAARIGDVAEIANDDLLAEVKEWKDSPALLQAVLITVTEGAGPGSYSTEFVDVVLTNRVIFDLHRAQFDELGLEVDPASEADQRTSLAPILAEVSGGFGDRLVGDLVRVNAVIDGMAEEYETWFTEAINSGIEVNPRYGTWDSQAGAVTPPEGPRPAPGGDLLLEL